MYNQAYAKYISDVKKKKVTGGKNVFNGRRGQSVMEMAANKLPSLHQTSANTNAGPAKVKGAPFMHRRNTSSLQQAPGGVGGLTHEGRIGQYQQNAVDGDAVSHYSGIMYASPRNDVNEVRSNSAMFVNENPGASRH